MADPRQTALVTGCSAGGIGHSIAREFNSRGVRTFATVRNKVSFPDDLTAEGIEGISLTVDDPESVRQCFEEVERLTGGKGLDFLVNNAGRNYTVPALDIDMSEVQGVFDTNVFGVMRMCQVFSPLLIKAKGTIVQTGSLAGVMPYVFGSVYNASKAALHAYSNTLRVELAPFGVKVVTVVTGGVKTSAKTLAREFDEERRLCTERRGPGDEGDREKVDLGRAHELGSMVRDDLVTNGTYRYVDD
ncbi:MAG: hypothetical protein M1834_003879 [Cirrosporium novae-zelandiae]|nr:MAG: hypothetical protein M1834_003879 [Cirrosporium novae-zelandiae]